MAQPLASVAGAPLAISGHVESSVELVLLPPNVPGAEEPLGGPGTCSPTLSAPLSGDDPWRIADVEIFSGLPA